MAWFCRIDSYHHATGTMAGMIGNRGNVGYRNSMILRDLALSLLVNGQVAGVARLQVAYAFEGCPHYASDPGRRPLAAIRAGWVRFVQQQQPAPAGKQHNHHRAAGNDARPLLSGSLPLSRRWHVERCHRLGRQPRRAHFVHQFA
jgi:hypothetical protein